MLYLIPQTCGEVLRKVVKLRIRQAAPVGEEKCCALLATGEFRHKVERVHGQGFGPPGNWPKRV